MKKDEIDCKAVEVNSL